MSTTAWVLGSFVAVGMAAYVFVPGVLLQRIENAERRRLLLSGEQAEAEILGYELDEFLFVRYRFVPNHGLTTVECKKMIGPLDERFPVGTRVSVRYKRSHPFISILEPYADTQTPW